jgi:hypothetical protein
MSDRNKNLDPRIEALLAGLRWRIRAYVWLEGISLALIWFGLTFWIGLALDYLPVLAGASEMPREARAVVLLVIAAVLAWIMYRWVFRRALVPLTNRSMALLLERQFRSFDDSLVTSVELTEQPSHAEQFDPRMLQQTEDEARDNTGVVRLRQVFNFTPLLRSGTIAAVLLATIVAFLCTELAGDGLVGQPHLPAARRTLAAQLADRGGGDRVAGCRRRAAAPHRSAADPLRRRPVAEGRQRLERPVARPRRSGGRGDSRGLHVLLHDGRRRTRPGHHEPAAALARRIPGIRLQRQTAARHPVVRVLRRRGYDYRVRDFKIEVVDSPAVIATELDCRFPDYLVDEELALWLPRTEPLTSATQLPRGTDVTIRVLTNKPLQRVDLYNPDTKELTTQNVQGDDAQRKQFEYRVPELADNLTLDVTCSTSTTWSPSGRTASSWQRCPTSRRASISSSAASARPSHPTSSSPSRESFWTTTRSIRTWFDFEMQRPGLTPDDQKTVRQSHDFSLLDAGRVDASLDFRALRSQETEPLELQPADKLVFSVKAADKHDLSGGPNVGSSDRYQLDVVTPDMLLAILESREIGQRRRLEQILEEMTQARDFLNRVHSAAPAGARAGDVLEAADETDQERPDPQRLAERNQSLRLLRTQQAYQQGRKSGQELLGVATAFRDIREELINNRVDTEDRKQRLKELIADPMQLIAETMFPELDRRIEQLEKLLAEAMNKRQFDLQMGEAEAKAAVDQANDILAELEEFSSRCWTWKLLTSYWTLCAN